VYQYLKYPAEAIRDGIQGKVMVDFVIGKDGKVTDVRVVKGVSEELDAEALRIVSASPKWKPGRMNGNKVRTSLTIPVEFKLEKKGGKSSFGIKKY
jgi:TonB family protein